MMMMMILCTSLSHYVAGEDVLVALTLECKLASCNCCGHFVCCFITKI